MNLTHSPGAEAVTLGTVLLALLTATAQDGGVDTPGKAGGGRQAVVPVLEAGSLVRYHFDDPVALRLDKGRIAVWAPEGVGALPGEIVVAGSAEAARRSAAVVPQDAQVLARDREALQGLRTD